MNYALGGTVNYVHDWVEKNSLLVVEVKQSYLEHLA